MFNRKRFLALFSGAALVLAACGTGSSADMDASGNMDSQAISAPESIQTEETDGTDHSMESDNLTDLNQIDNTKWQYNEDDAVYYQLEIQYCEKPADAEYEKLAIIVPAAYMDATDNGDGAFTCSSITEKEVNGYTAKTAPIVFPVNTPGYAAQSPMTEYSSVSTYTDAGFIYAHAGCRGRDAGAPAGVTDLKAAIRYLRYNDGNIAGNMESIFTFGMSGGGAQSALLGVTGDSSLYDDYLEAIGAVMGVSDSVLGSMGWCPITSLDSADEAYEWMMGATRSGLTDEEKSITDSLTSAYAEYINNLGLTDRDGNSLTLEASEDGRYQSGTYYEYMVGVIEESLNNFLADTEFPYDPDISSQGHQAGMGPGGAIGGPGGGRPNGEKPGDEKPDHEMGSTQGGKDIAAGEEVDYTAIDDISRTKNSSGVSISGTFETAQDYIDALNANGNWVTYDETANTAKIKSIADFAAAVKTASKGIAAFDQLDRSQGENTLFGYGDGEGAHFDSILESILKELGSKYASDYEKDLSREDSEGHTVEYRLNMYSPLYYLLSGSEGYQTANVAKYFRINTGLWQSDTAVNTEANLVLALQNYGSDVDYGFVWGQEHTMAERSGNSTDNFIEWVNKCVAGAD